MYGAGNIGRGFIGQVFSLAGYSVGFIDINKEVIARLNADKEYPVDVVSNDGLEEIIVKNVRQIRDKINAKKQESQKLTMLAKKLFEEAVFGEA